MADFDRVAAAIRALAEACGEVMDSLSEWVHRTAKELSEDVLPTIIRAAAYSKAKTKNPEWVHRAVYSKKKRIRKKYHDRIMREYGGE